MSERAFSSIHVVINPAAGQDEPILNTLNRVFTDYDVSWSVSITHEDGDGEHRAQAAVEEGADLVMAYGGDGTVMEVASGLIGTDVPLGVLPGGTGNALAFALNIPQNLEDAARSLLSEEAAVRAMDIGQANDRYFILRLMTGLGVDMLTRASRELKDRFGVMAYVVAGLMSLSTPPDPVTYRLTLDGETIETEGIACLIANSAHVGRFNFVFSQAIDPLDGLLDVIVIDTSLSLILKLATSLTNLEDVDERLSQGIQTWQCKEVTIDVDPPQVVRGDGEDSGMTPITVRVLPGSLNVLALPETP